jgi:hypothetical protein
MGESVWESTDITLSSQQPYSNRTEPCIVRVGLHIELGISRAPTSVKTQQVSFFSKIAAVCSENHMKAINVLSKIKRSQCYNNW